MLSPSMISSELIMALVTELLNQGSFAFDQDD